MAALLNGKAFELTHLFEAHYTDGTMLAQMPEDQSSIDPARSSFYDVLQYQKDGKALSYFGLYSAAHIYAVSLVDGHFEIDGIAFQAHPSAGPLPEGGKYTLIYCRDHQQDYKTNQKTGEVTEGEHRIAYRFGWEYTAGSQTWQQTIVVF